MHHSTALIAQSFPTVKCRGTPLIALAGLRRYFVGLEGLDKVSCVWLAGEGGVHVNLGPRDAVAEKMCQWLSAIDYGECRQ